MKKETPETASSEKLAAQVVAFRALGWNPDGATQCMIELCRRREQGDDFDFEKYIEEESKKIPTLQNAGLKKYFP